MVDRLYENMLELIRDGQEYYSNSTLCNLKYVKSKSCIIHTDIVIVHYVI